MTAPEAATTHTPHTAHSPHASLDYAPKGADPRRHLVLLGAGDAHLQLLLALSKRPIANVRVVWVTPTTNHVHPDMLAGLVAGIYTPGQCSIALEPLARHAGVRWLVHNARSLDAQQQTLTLDDASTLTYDWLSIDTGPTHNRALAELALPGARTHGLFVYPTDAFAALWPRVVALGTSRAVRVAVLGAGSVGIEIACALRHQLPNAAVTWVSGPHKAGYLEPATQRVLGALKTAGVTVLQEVATSISTDKIDLQSGASLACDVPVLALPAQPPAWLANSGLALAENGFAAVNACLQSTSHPQVFCAGTPSLGAGACLLENLRRAVAGAMAGTAACTTARIAADTAAGVPLQAHVPQSRPLRLLSCGAHCAIGSWSKYSVQGRWVWWLKHWLNKRYLAKYRGGAA